MAFKETYIFINFSYFHIQKEIICFSYYLFLFDIKFCDAKVYYLIFILFLSKMNVTARATTVTDATTISTIVTVLSGAFLVTT